MAPLTTEDQFKFLITCIKHSTAGKIDFAQVATECEIISKGAAAKRYERLMKTHGISGNGGGGGRTASPAPTNSATATPKGKTGGKARTPASKKRKLAASGEDIDEDIKHEIKKEPVKAEQKDQVKSETDTKVDDELSPQDNSSDDDYVE